jgi:hypothetical protein
VGRLGGVELRDAQDHAVAPLRREPRRGALGLGRSAERADVVDRVVLVDPPVAGVVVRERDRLLDEAGGARREGGIDERRMRSFASQACLPLALDSGGMLVARLATAS